MPQAIKKLSDRIITFDLLRGFFLLVILLNHLQYYPSGLELLTGRGQLYVSTAEGFFLVSGIILGIVRGRKLLGKPFSVSAKLILKRALQLYVIAVALTLIFTFIGWFFIGDAGLKTGIYPAWQNIPHLIWQSLTLNYVYGWADFLRYYAIFLLAAPLAIYLLRKGFWYIVLIISAIVWCLYPFSPFPHHISQLLSWQFLFFSGLVIGFYWQDIIAKWRSLSIKTRKYIGLSFAITFLITTLITFVLVFGHKFLGPAGSSVNYWHHIIEQYFEKDRLPIARILLGTIWFWGLFWIFRRFEDWIVRRFGWLLLDFGVNSLYVYTISAFVIFLMHLFVMPAGGVGSVLINLVLSILGVAIVVLAVKTKFLMKIIPR